MFRNELFNLRNQLGLGWRAVSHSGQCAELERADPQLPDSSGWPAAREDRSAVIYWQDWDQDVISVSLRKIIFTTRRILFLT